jgi:hypothetical protein
MRFNRRQSTMAENKTKPTKVSVASYLASIKSEGRRKDCETLSKLMTKITKSPAVMWGPSIVGFGNYHYVYESGREGDMCIAGFSSRKDAIVVYLMAEFTGKAELLKKLGKHKTGKGCLYLKNLDDVDPKVLEKLVVDSIAELKRRNK